jgi:outer membrane immunogenic protein
MRDAFSESVSGGTVSTTTFSQEAWRWGWAAGLGAETRIGQSDWLGRIEYLHYDFGRTADSSSVSNGVAAAISEGRLTTDVIRAGLSYQLN